MFLLIFVFKILLCCLAEKVEFCTWQIFQPRCSNNEIIVIEEAVFGRKTMGRCLTEEGVSMENNLEDPKFLGCYADVKGYLEQQCAGKKQCDISVVNIQVETNCHKWLKFHLEVDYSCLPVVQESRHCSVSLSGGKQFITSYQHLKNGCGSRNQPWIVESLAGQSISASVVHTKDTLPRGIQFLTQDHEKQSSCNSLGKFIDKQNRKEYVLCLLPEGAKYLETNRYLSASNSIEVILFDLKNLSLGYVLAFEAVGCSDLIPPADAWLKRSENEATIGCYSTRLRWQLKCVGQRWMGVIGNCSHGLSPMSIQLNENGRKISEAHSTENDLVPIVAIAMTGFVICFLIVCIGVVFINRYYALSKSKLKKQMTDLEIPKNEYNNETLALCGTDKLTLSGKIGDCGVNGTLLNGMGVQDPAHYFELDQSYVGKDYVPSKV